MSRALLLAGHGSHLDPNASPPIHAHADRIRERGLFDEVAVAFWKEEPALSRAFDAIEATDITIVPVFISDGYFTREVLPRELGICSPLTERDGRRIRYTLPVGSHPALAAVIVERAREAGATPADAVAVLGHGTPRNPASERNVIEQAARVRALGAFAEVEPIFLEQEPHMSRLLDLVAAPSVVVVPLFIADGWHVGQSIPAELALEGPVTRRSGRTVRYAAAAGTHQRVADVILDLAAEASRS